MLDTKNILFDEFHLISFHMYYLLVPVQELLAIFKAFVLGATISSRIAKPEVRPFSYVYLNENIPLLNSLRVNYRHL